METLTTLASKSVSEIVHLAIEHDNRQQMLVIYDTDCELAQILSDAYQASFPLADFVQFYEQDKAKVLGALESLSENDLVVLVQTGDFRLNEFRIRLHLFERGIKVVDHRHLSRNTADSYETYINALSYDPEWYRGTGHALKDRLTGVERLQIFCGDQELIVEGGLEDPKPNLGDYREMKNTGGAFPIGEVFTEAKTLESANGSLMIYAFADVNFNIVMRDPFRIDIAEGLVVGWADNAPQEFIDVIEKIRGTERAIMREIGFGLNRAITREHYIKDITAFERILGMHVSLGEKHTVYKKEGIKAKKSRFHVDLFLDVTQVLADGEEIFKDGEYLV